MRSSAMRFVSSSQQHSCRWFSHSSASNVRGSLRLPNVVHHSSRSFSATSKANVVRSLIANGLICTAKTAAFLTSGSSAMLSEACHSAVDCGNQMFLLGKDMARFLIVFLTFLLSGVVFLVEARFSAI
jgi:hypothetical protein